MKRSSQKKLKTYNKVGQNSCKFAHTYRNFQVGTLIWIGTLIRKCRVQRKLPLDPKIPHLSLLIHTLMCSSISFLSHPWYIQYTYWHVLANTVFSITTQKTLLGFLINTTFWRNGFIIHLIISKVIYSNLILMWPEKPDGFKILSQTFKNSTHTTYSWNIKWVSMVLYLKK